MEADGITMVLEREERGVKDYIFRVLLTIGVCFLACGLYYHYVVQTALVEVSIAVDQKTDFKIYWAGSGQNYTERHMSVVQVKPGKKDYHFLLTNLEKVERLRIDPHSYEGRVELEKLKFSQIGLQSLILQGESGIAALQPLTQIAEVKRSEEGIVIISNGNDPTFEFRPVFAPQDMNWLWLTIRLLFIAALVFPPAWACERLVKEFRFVPLMLFGVFMLIIVMAGTSKRNVHPDEYVHLDAAMYYQDNWLPPVMDDPAIQDTYSVYGVSRLNNGEVYYLFAGKFDKLFEGMHIPEPVGLRLFNIFLFGLIIWYTICHPASRPVALPFLISPQIWYVFSYCDSDAFALFITFLAASQLVDSGSLLHRYLLGENRRAKLGGFMVLGALLGLCLLLKKNYMPFTVFFFICLGIKLFFTPEFYWERREAILRLVVLLVAACSLYGLRVGLDHHVNGPNLSQKKLEMRELLAKPEYKPSAPVDKRHIFLQMRERGVTLKEIVTVDRWFEKSFQSAFGVYGYFAISGSTFYFDMVRWLGVGLLGYLLFSIFVHGGWLGWGVTICGLGLSVALIGASVYHSWVVDFQCQGRYLFAIVPIMGILCGWFVQCFRQRILFVGCTAMYIVGLYSFIFEALLKTPRMGF